jgi:1,4-dihydroxy-2-naphthoyl-CoA hydrolase
MVRTLKEINDGRPPFTKLLGVEFIRATPDEVEATMLVRPDMCTPHHTCHGGALMTFADTVGAVSTVVNMPDDARTMTMESKTNFLRGAPEGQVLRAVTTRVHEGRRTQVWRTDIFREDDKLVATVTQTQMVVSAGG